MLSASCSNAAGRGYSMTLSVANSATACGSSLGSASPACGRVKCDAPSQGGGTNDLVTAILVCG
jgi:hypothetical protein